MNTTLATVLIVLACLAGIYLLIGVGIAFFVTQAGGESFTLDKNTMMFIAAWPIMFFMGSR